MRQVFENELNKFDRERVVPAWEGVIARQQAALEKLGVPAMFTSSEKQDMEVSESSVTNLQARPILTWRVESASSVLFRCSKVSSGQGKKKRTRHRSNTKHLTTFVRRDLKEGASNDVTSIYSDSFHFG